MSEKKPLVISKTMPKLTPKPEPKVEPRPAAAEIPVEKDIVGMAPMRDLGAKPDPIMTTFVKEVTTKIGDRVADVLITLDPKTGSLVYAVDMGSSLRTYRLDGEVALQVALDAFAKLTATKKEG